MIGASGLVGSHIFAEATRRHVSVVGTYRQNAVANMEMFDSSNAGAVECLLHKYRPAAVVYTAGWTWVDGCETDPARAFRENASEPAEVARICCKHGTHFTFFSSSYVFRGDKEQYDEDDIPLPVNVYGRSKLDGERAVTAVCDGHALIVRVLWVYGAELQGKNFAYQVWRAMVKGEQLFVASDQYGNPSYAGDIAVQLLPLVYGRQFGVRHLGNLAAVFRRPEWAQLLADALVASGVEQHASFAICETPSAAMENTARRPAHAEMTSKYSLSDSTDFKTAVRMLVRQSRSSYDPTA